MPHIAPLIRLACASVPVLALAPTGAWAETQRSFQVTASVVRGCVVGTDAGARLGQIAFGTVPGTARGTRDAAMTSAGAAGIAVECTPDTDVTLTADLGDHAAGEVRRMALGGGQQGFVAYQLYVDGASTPWTTQSIPLKFATGATQRTLPVVGRAALTGSMASGSYSDTVRVTVAW